MSSSSVVRALRKQADLESGRYAYAGGSRVGIPLETAVRELERIYARDQVITPEAVVGDAQPKESPLHDHFEWNNKVAAHEYRLDQARALVRAVLFVPESSPPVRAFVSIGCSTTGEGGEETKYNAYRTVRDVMADPAQRAATLRRARMEAQAYYDRYQAFEELSKVIQAIKSLDA